jgi:hypothetical protein
MSLGYFDSKKYEIAPAKFKIDSIILNLRKKVHEFEFSPLKNKKKVGAFQKNVIMQSFEDLKAIEKEIKGFNLQACFLAIALYHQSYIYLKKVLLNEMRKKALPHMGICLTIGVINGMIFGHYFGKSYSLYKSYKDAHKQVNKINKDFEFYYVARNEEEFDE